MLTFIWKTNSCTAFFAIDSTGEVVTSKIRAPIPYSQRYFTLNCERLDFLGYTQFYRILE